jgi:energy-coupling factor transporter ATP-binding protein EcfA2
MKELSTNVFTPARPAKLTFVERKDINQKLVDALKTPGKQLLIYGYTGSGKTSLIKNKLLQTYENSITTSCTEGMQFEQLILQAFDKFDAFFTTERVKEKSRDNLIGLEANYNLIKAQISSSHSSKTSEKQERIVPLQLTPQKLAEFFGKLNSCWVIEDFHKMEPAEKKNFLS